MISRPHGLALSLLLGAASAAGAYAVIGTAHLGDAQTKPEVATSRQIAVRVKKLDAWEASLRQALRARPPALPALNRYATVAFVAAPAAAALPAPAPGPRRAAQGAEPAAEPVAAKVVKKKKVVKKTTEHADKEPSEHIDAVAAPDREEPVSAALVVAAPAHDAATPAPESAPVVAAATPAPTASQPATPPATPSVEQQCRQLLRAAEGKSEVVKQEAERQCEALKQAAERKE
jgi:hypothetical protein